MKITSIILIIATTLTITGCTVEKRLFQPGYSIEWKKKIPQKGVNEITSTFSESKEDVDSITRKSSSNSLLLDRENQSLSLHGKQNIPTEDSTKSISKVPVETQKHIISNGNENHEIDSNPSQKKAIDIPESEDKKELEIFGTMSFGLYFCSLALAITALTFMNPGYILIVAGFMIILSLIFGIISVDRYRRDKSKYYRNFFGYFGLIASIVTISLVIGLAILASGLGSF